MTSETYVIAGATLAGGGRADLRIADGTPDVAQVPQLSPPDHVVVNQPTTYVSRSASI